MNTKEIYLVMAGTDYEGSVLLAVYRNEADADNAINDIQDWRSNKPPLPRDNAPESEWDCYLKYNDTFQFGTEYHADRYYKVTIELR